MERLGYSEWPTQSGQLSTWEAWDSLIIEQIVTRSTTLQPHQCPHAHQLTPHQDQRQATWQAGGAEGVAAYDPHSTLGLRNSSLGFRDAGHALRHSQSSHDDSLQRCDDEDRQLAEALHMAELQQVTVSDRALAHALKDVPLQPSCGDNSSSPIVPQRRQPCIAAGDALLARQLQEALQGATLKPKPSVLYNRHTAAEQDLAKRLERATAGDELLARQMEQLPVRSRAASRPWRWGAGGGGHVRRSVGPRRAWQEPDGVHDPLPVLTPGDNTRGFDWRSHELAAAPALPPDIMQLQRRELTAEDYEVLSGLDDRNIAADTTPTSGLTKEVFSRLPVTRASGPMLLQECAICQEKFKRGDKVATLPCLHQFHAENCIWPWLQRKNICPIDLHPALVPH